MNVLTEAEIRASFINCSKGDTKRMGMPINLATVPWNDIDFLGWRDPASTTRSYVVVPQNDLLIGIALTHESHGSPKAQMCKICLTTHPSGGVSMMSARKAGSSGRQGNSVGTYICSDLACSLYARNKRSPSLGRQYKEDLDISSKVDRVINNIDAFVARVRI